MRFAITMLLTLGLAAAAGANSFTVEGVVLEGEHGYTWQRDSEWLVTDGSFESGECDLHWTCESDNDFYVIRDLVPQGLWNYDGGYVAWLGGFIGIQATCTASICQELYFGYPCGPPLTWWWMAYVNEGGSQVSVTIDGEVIWSRVLEPADHLLDYQMDVAYDTYELYGTYVLCFEYVASDCETNQGDNYFVDYIEAPAHLTAAERACLSTVKSLY